MSKAQFLEIPHTSLTSYISGIVALNIPSKSGTGDWHEENVFFTPRVRIPRSFIIERGQEFDPSALLGDVGIYDAAPLLDKMGVKHPPGPVFAASHARAVADMVLVSILRVEPTAHVSQIDDWFHTGAQIHEVVSIVESALPRLSPEQAQSLASWIKRVRIDQEIIETLTANEHADGAVLADWECTTADGLDDCNEIELGRIRAAIAIGVAEADRGEVMPIAESKARTLAAIKRIADEHESA